MSSDPHLGSDALKAKPPVTTNQVVETARKTVADMLALPGTVYPSIGPLKTLPLAKVAKPRGIIVAGDLTDKGAWSLFETVFPPNGLDRGSIPLYLCAGNHDGDPDSPTRRGIIARNRQRWDERQLTAISSNGLHYAWNWEGVHFVCVNLCPADATDAETPFQYGKPGPGSWNDPLGALTFLIGYLRDHVGPGGAPVIIWQHYGFCEGFNFDWNWWSARQRRAVYDAIKDYNVVALLHGHTHAPDHYRWPDTQANPKEVQRLFGDHPPPDLRSFDVFSAGSFGGGTYYVFRITADQFIAAHRNRKGWTPDPRMHLAKDLVRGSARDATKNRVVK